MKKLPEVGSEVLTYYGTKATIINHFEDKAVYLYHNDAGMVRADLAVASWFKPIEPEKPEEQPGCNKDEHNYVQIHEAHSNRAFCTRCGKTISLE